MLGSRVKTMSLGVKQIKNIQNVIHLKTIEPIYELLFMGHTMKYGSYLVFI